VDVLIEKLPFKSNVLILDFEDINGVITHFGRYVSDKLYIKLTDIGSNINLIERRSIELALKEQVFQISGYVDEKTAVKISSLTGATHIISGIVTELGDKISIDVKILDVERGLIIGGVSHEILKTREINSLIGTIIRSEEQKQKELELQRQKILQEIEEEKEKRMKALEEEEKKKNAELSKLDEEIRKKSIIIIEYEQKKKQIYEQDAYIQQIHREIDELNRNVLRKLKIGMSLSQVQNVLGKSNIFHSGYDDWYIAGKYFIHFSGNILTKVVENGSRSETGHNIVNDVIGASVYGVNVAPY